MSARTTYTIDGERRTDSPIVAESFSCAGAHVTANTGGEA